MNALLRGKTVPIMNAPNTGCIPIALVAEAEKLYVSAPASLFPHPTGANYFTLDLAGLKAMTQELADLFGLSLPVLCKKPV
jgi:hypothetical protein